jgi:hypothetical protein
MYTRHGPVYFRDLGPQHFAPSRGCWLLVRAALNQASGAHQLQCYAFDAAANVGYSQTVTVYK